MNMNKWYIRRDFSVAAERLGRRGQFLSSDAPPPDALFWEMWQECEPIARQVLETAYFKGILNNDLDPNAYGALMVQDAYYCFKAQDAYAAAATHPLDDACGDFLQGKYTSYEEYNAYYHETWHVREASGVIPGDEIKEYAAYEAFVAGNLDSPYLFSVMLPCEYLWNWIANELDKTAPKHALYYFWIEVNGGIPDGAYQMANMLESYRRQIDEAKAKEIFRIALQHELKVFTAATLLKSELLWQRKNSILQR